MYTLGCQLWAVPRLPPENVEFTQIRSTEIIGLTPLPTWGSRETRSPASLKTTTGTGIKENRLYLPFFSYPDYHIPENFTINPWRCCG